MLGPKSCAALVGWLLLVHPIGSSAQTPEHPRAGAQRANRAPASLGVGALLLARSHVALARLQAQNGNTKHVLVHLDEAIASLAEAQHASTDPKQAAEYQHTAADLRRIKALAAKSPKGLSTRLASVEARMKAWDARH